MSFYQIVLAGLFSECLCSGQIISVAAEQADGDDGDNWDDNDDVGDDDDDGRDNCDDGDHDEHDDGGDGGDDDTTVERCKSWAESRVTPR